MLRNGLVLVLTIVLSVLAVARSQAAVVLVDPTNLNGWAFNTTDNNGTVGLGSGTGDFVTGPATPPIGTGSAHLQTPAGGGDQSVQLRNTSWAGTSLSALTSLSYSTYATSWNGQQLPYLTLYLDTDGVPGYDDRLHFEPTYSDGPNPGTEAQGTWQTWDALNGKWYADSQGGQSINDVFSLTDYANFSTAVIVNAAPGLGGIRLTSGFASDTDNFNTNVDNFTIGTAAGTTTYNFEPATTAVPEASSLILWSVLVATIGSAFWYRRQMAVG